MADLMPRWAPGIMAAGEPGHAAAVNLANPHRRKDAVRSWLVADLGGTKIQAARVTASGRLQELMETPTPAAGGEAVMAALLALLRRYDPAAIAAVAVDVPGLAYPDGDVWAPNLLDWTHFPLRRRLQQALGKPVLVESDRNAFMAGELWRGAARGCRDAICLMIGTGIGAGIYSDGRLLRGHDQLAGAVGWMAIRDTWRADYHSRGCLESHVAGPGLAEMARAAGLACDTRALLAAARQGERSARRILAQAGRDLGLGLANLVSLLNPEIIILAGWIGQAAGRELLPVARASLSRWAQPLAAKKVRLTLSRLGHRAPLLGLAALAGGLLPAPPSDN